MSIHNAIRGIGVAACVAIGMLLFAASRAFAAASVHLPNENRQFSRFLAFETYGLEPNLGSLGSFGK